MHFLFLFICHLPSLRLIVLFTVDKVMTDVGGRWQMKLFLSTIICFFRGFLLPLRRKRFDVWQISIGR